MEIRRLAEGRYAAKHILGDKQGSPPSDGQRGEMEYALNDPAELAAHVQQHMGPIEPDEDDA